MNDRPGFKVTRYTIHDDEVIEIDSIAAESSELDELLELFDELRDELNKTREAGQIIHRENVRLRTELGTALGELRTLKTENELRRLGFAGPGDRVASAGRKFVPDGRGGEIEFSAHKKKG